MVLFILSLTEGPRTLDPSFLSVFCLMICVHWLCYLPRGCRILPVSPTPKTSQFRGHQSSDTQYRSTDGVRDSRDGRRGRRESSGPFTMYTKLWLVELRRSFRRSEGEDEVGTGDIKKIISLIKRYNLTNVQTRRLSYSRNFYPPQSQ